MFLVVLSIEFIPHAKGETRICVCLQLLSWIPYSGNLGALPSTEVFNNHHWPWLVKVPKGQ